MSRGTEKGVSKGESAFCPRVGVIRGSGISATEKFRLIAPDGKKHLPSHEKEPS
jgi:hypothetical protein